MTRAWGDKSAWTGNLHRGDADYTGPRAGRNRGGPWRDNASRPHKPTQTESETGAGIECHGRPWDASRVIDKLVKIIHCPNRSKQQQGCAKGEDGECLEPRNTSGTKTTATARYLGPQWTADSISRSRRAVRTWRCEPPLLFFFFLNEPPLPLPNEHLVLIDYLWPCTARRRAASLLDSDNIHKSRGRTCAWSIVSVPSGNNKPRTIGPRSNHSNSADLEPVDGWTREGCFDSGVSHPRARSWSSARVSEQVSRFTQPVRTSTSGVRVLRLAIDVSDAFHEFETADANGQRDQQPECHSERAKRGVAVTNQVPRPPTNPRDQIVEQKVQ